MNEPHAHAREALGYLGVQDLSLAAGPTGGRNIRGSFLSSEQASLAMSRQDLQFPIDSKLPEIAAALDDSQFVVINGPTGCGKSTRVPEFLLRMGYRVITTEPRILACTSLPSWVAPAFEEEVGESVGFRTAKLRCESDVTRLHYVTDGLQLVRELSKHTHQKYVLIIDEFHERNLNQDLLLGVVKRGLQDRQDVRVIVQSATQDAQRISAFLGGAPVVTTEGRTFPITRQEPGESIEADAIELLRAGRNVLVFQPGTREIYDSIAAMNASGLDAVILPLHRKLDIREQQRCFEKYDVPKCVVATNIAETSLTIPDIDAVVDSGLRRIVRTIRGIQGLYLESISLAEQAQRFGRGGRTKPGIAITHCQIPDEKRPKYPVPEILRLQLENAELRAVVGTGSSLKSFSFLDSPPQHEVPRARKNLTRMGCIDGNGMPSKMGEEISTWPVSVNLGRMLYEARREGVLASAIQAAALIEAGGIVEGENHKWRGLFCSRETRSDLFAQLRVYNQVRPLLLADRVEELADMGVNIDALARAVEHERDLAERIQLGSATCAHKRERDALTRCFVQGFRSHIFFKTGEGWVSVDEPHVVRKLRRDSVVQRESPYLAAIPWDLGTSEGSTQHGVKHFLTWATALDESQVPDEVAGEKRTFDRRGRETPPHRPQPRRR